MLVDKLVYGLIGLVVGGIIGGYTMGRMCAREYRKRIEQLQNENDQLIEERRRTASRASESRLRALEEAEKQLDKNLASLGVKEAKKAIDIYRGKDENEDEEEDNDDDLMDDDFDFDDPFKEDENGSDLTELPIRMISKEQYDKDSNSRAIEKLTYYQEDGILTDSMQDVVHDQSIVLGEEAMGIIDETSKDEIYIDNPVDDTLYDVVIEHNLSYYRDVVGV